MWAAVVGLVELGGAASTRPPSRPGAIVNASAEPPE